MTGELFREHEAGAFRLCLEMLPFLMPLTAMDVVWWQFAYNPLRALQEQDCGLWHHPHSSSYSPGEDLAPSMCTQDDALVKVAAGTVSSVNPRLCCTRRPAFALSRMLSWSLIAVSHRIQRCKISYLHAYIWPAYVISADTLCHSCHACCTLCRRHCLKILLGGRCSVWTLQTCAWSAARSSSYIIWRRQCT